MKKQGNQLTIDFVTNPDILAHMGQLKKADQVVCGFAMETQDLVENATKKLVNKGADLIVANQLNEDAAGFKKDTNVVTMLTGEGVTKLDVMSKEALGYEIMNRLVQILVKKRGIVC